MKQPRVFRPEGNLTISAEVTFAEPVGVVGGTQESSQCENITDISGSDPRIHTQSGIVDCGAYIFTQCIANLSSPPFAMSITYAINSVDGLRRAKMCRSDVTSATFYSEPVGFCVEQGQPICNA